jgi:hypothetical protein
LLSRFEVFARKHRLEEQDDEDLAVVRAFLGEQMVLRLFLENSNNFGHQTSSLSFMFTLRALGFRGTFEIVVAGPEMLQLFEEEGVFAWVKQEPSIQLFELDDISNYKCINLCLTGGYDNEGEDALGSAPVTLQSNCFIALQPWKFEQINLASTPRILILSDEQRRSAFLDEEVEGISSLEDLEPTVYSMTQGRAAFLNMGYLPPFVPESCGQALDSLSNDQEKQRALTHVLGTPGRYHVGAAYGLMRNFSIRNDCSATILFRYTTALCRTTLTKKSVVVVFHDNVAQILEQKLDRSPYGVKLLRCNEFEKIDTCPEPVIILLVGKVPQDVFNYVYATCNLPPIFEGEGTMPIALNRGRPFLYMKGGDHTCTDETFYPVFGNFHNEAKRMGAIANLLHTGKRPDDVCIENLIKLFEICLNNKASSLKLLAYFEEMKEHYTNLQNNRLVVTLRAAIKLLQERGMWRQ